MKAQIIEKENKFYKECRVIMLESNNSSHVLLNPANGILYYHKQLCDLGAHKLQHLYITNDDEIKEGDWFYSTENTIEQFKGSVMPIKDDKKIIATTDKSLFDDKPSELGQRNKVRNYLPQQSDKFIEAYIEAYNEGKKIEKVLVEYEKGNFKPDNLQRYFEPGSFTFEWQLKHKDKNIIIKKVKDSWTREEVVSLLNLAMATASAVGMSTQKEADEWINNNL